MLTATKLSRCASDLGCCITIYSWLILGQDRSIHWTYLKIHWKSYADSPLNRFACCHDSVESVGIDENLGVSQRFVPPNYDWEASSIFQHMKQAHHGTDDLWRVCSGASPARVYQVDQVGILMKDIEIAPAAFIASVSSMNWKIHWLIPQQYVSMILPSDWRDWSWFIPEQQKNRHLTWQSKWQWKSPYFSYPCRFSNEKWGSCLIMGILDHMACQTWCIRQTSTVNTVVNPKINHTLFTNVLLLGAMLKPIHQKGVLWLSLPH